MAETVRYRFFGDEDKARMIKGSAVSGVSVLKNLMDAGGLSQYGIQRRFADGSTVIINSCFGTTVADVFCPISPLISEEVAVPIQEEVVEEEISNRVLVYVGPYNNKFSEYGVEDLMQRTLYYWGVIPQETFADLFEKKLLVLPCPVRVLTSNELKMVKAFLGEERRLALFCGTDGVIANSILRQLNSKLDIIPAASDGIKNMSGRLPNKTLVWWPGDIVGWINVNQAYWDTALVKDIKGFGLLYDNVTSIKPTFALVAGVGIPSSITDFVGIYQYSEDLIARINAYHHPPDPEVTIAWIVFTGYPSGYIPYDYGTPLSLTEYRDWMFENKENLPLYYIHPHEYMPSKTSFAYGQYINLSDYKYRDRQGSEFAYATGENIIVATFKPSWLTLGNPPNEIAAGFKTKELSNWLLNGSLVYADNFDQRGFQAVSPADLYYTIGLGSGGFGSTIQY